MSSGISSRSASLRAPGAMMTMPNGRATMRHAIVLMALMLVAAVAAVALKPTTRLADQGPALNLEAEIPRAFAGWRVDETGAADIVNPQAQTLVKKLYSQVLERTYVEPATGARVMLSIAYGGDQSDSLQLHVPDVCYPAQGFEVVGASFASISGGASALPVKRLITRQGARTEPLIYWVTVGNKVELSGATRKLAQLRYGFRGIVPDGLIVRVSSIDTDTSHAWAIQQRFIADLLSTSAPPTRVRLAGI